MDRTSAIRKIKACLGRAQSSNPNEAATALRQARAMMEKFNINELEVGEDSHGFSTAVKARKTRPPAHLKEIGLVVAGVFRVQLMEIKNSATRTIVLEFVGPTANVELAEYAMAQMVRAHKAHLKTYKAGLLPQQRRHATSLSRSFTLGWTQAVRSALPPQPLTADELAPITKAIAMRGMHLSDKPSRAGSAKPKPLTEAQYRAAMDGFRAGKSVQLTQGIKAGNGQGEQLAIGHE